jgi:protein-disulfide isomerase
MNRRDMLVLGGLVGAGGLATWALRAFRPLGTLLGPTPVVTAVEGQPLPTGGNLGGRLSLTVFTDYNCPICRAAHPDMLAAVGADADVKLRYLDWPVFGADSEAAARAALGADFQGLYAPVHDALMRGGRADGAAAEQALAAAGGDVARLRATLAAEGPALEARLARHAFLAFSLGLAGTPSYLIGSLLVQGALDERAFARAFQNARRAG